MSYVFKSEFFQKMGAADYAFVKGWRAADDGELRNQNPYGDVRDDGNKRITFSSAFCRQWFKGWEAYHGCRV